MSKLHDLILRVEEAGNNKERESRMVAFFCEFLITPLHVPANDPQSTEGKFSPLILSFEEEGKEVHFVAAFEDPGAFKDDLPEGGLLLHMGGDKLVKDFPADPSVLLVLNPGSKSAWVFDAEQIAWLQDIVKKGSQARRPNCTDN